MTDTEETVSEVPEKKAAETDAEATERRAAELRALMSEHREGVARAHRDFPVPSVTRRSVRFTRLTREQQITYNMRRKRIDGLNDRYAAAVSAACRRHRAENPTHEAQRSAARIAVAKAAEIRKGQGRSR